MLILQKMQLIISRVLQLFSNYFYFSNTLGLINQGIFLCVFESPNSIDLYGKIGNIWKRKRAFLLELP